MDEVRDEPLPWTARALPQLTLVRFREFVREPEAVFWTFFFPVVLAIGLGIAFRNKPADAVKVAVVRGTPGADTVAARIARSAGIEVRVLVDDLFSWRAGRRRLARLRRAGGKVAFFMPMLRLPLRGRRPDLRNHRKILVVDGDAAIVGGMNIAREYMGPEKLAGRWRDVGIRVDGPAAVALDDVFRSDWAFAAREAIAATPPRAPRPGEGEDVTDAADAAEADDADAADAADAIVRVVLSGPDVREDHFYDAMLTGFFAAKRRIWIATPYFVPDEALTHALALAARRGVDVRVVVPARSNHWSADLAGAGYLRQVEEAGGRVFRYAPAMMHGKVIVIDEVGTLGSANMDIRSLFLNYEVALFFTSPTEVEALAGWIASLLPECTAGMPAAGPVRALAEDLGRLLSPLI
jgi:cardiolipin synthase